MSKYAASEVIDDVNHPYAHTADSVEEILRGMTNTITNFLDANPDCRWINVGFSNDGVTERNIAISRL